MLISPTLPLATLSSLFRSRAAIELENLALRHQIGVLRRSAAKRPKFTSGDQPDTVIAWRRAGFRLFWTWKARHGEPGRPVLSREVRDLIRFATLPTVSIVRSRLIVPSDRTKQVW